MAALAMALLQGCASGPSVQPEDPLEPFNRGVFRFNEGLDRAVLKPVAIAYRNATPMPVRTSVNSFFENISDVWSTVNNALQGKPVETVNSLFRVTVNTFWGVGGIFDVATLMNIPKHKEDFGQTLGYWGVETGPYLVLPVFGSSSIRDAFGLLVDRQGNLVTQMDNVALRNSLTGLNLVDTRAGLLNVGNVLDAAALDKYTFTRDIYLHRRQNLIREESRQLEERFDLPEGAPGAAGPGAAVAPAAPAAPVAPASNAK